MVSKAMERTRGANFSKIPGFKFRCQVESRPTVLGAVTKDARVEGKSKAKVEGGTEQPENVRPKRKKRIGALEGNKLEDNSPSKRRTTGAREERNFLSQLIDTEDVFVLDQNVVHAEQSSGGRWDAPEWNQSAKEGWEEHRPLPLLEDTFEASQRCVLKAFSLDVSDQ